MSNTVVFPGALLAGGTSTSDNAASVSAHSHRATALEICELVYAPARPSWDALERFYEPGATYESPLVTATSRAAIADVHALAHRLAQLDVPRPAALLHALLGGGDGGAALASFTAVRVWDEVRDVAETDSFDGHHKAIVEHTLHIDLLPGLLGPGSLGPSAPPASASAASSPAAPSELVAVSSPHHPLPRPRDPPPPPLRLSLPVLTRLSFNDAGRITHHRDFWDAKDLLGLLPGMALVQWVATRALAHGISALVRAGRVLVRARGDGDGDEGAGGRDEEEGLARGRAIKGSSGAGRAQA